MLKKILIGLLSTTVVGSVGAAVAYQAAQPDVAEVPQVEVVAAEEIAMQAGNPQGGYGSGPQGQGQAGVQQQVVAAQETIGIPWTGMGIIESFDDFGFTLALDSGLAIYVELGPPAFWQAQGITLAAGQSVTVEGFTSDGMYHAAVVTFADSSQLVVRDLETGQPLWSGGATNGSGNGNAAANGLQDGSHTPQPQASVDEWVTLEGTITAINRSNITMTLADGTSLTFQAGQPSFFTSQGVTLQVGDAISVLGFYQNDQFMAGEIVQTATGLRVMLRDPNGRPLWAGPGGSGSGGNGNGYGGGR